MCGRCSAPDGHLSQPPWRWVSTWMGDRRSAVYTFRYVYISKRWAGGQFFRDCRLGTVSVIWSAVSAQVFCSFPVPSCECDTASIVCCIAFARSLLSMTEWLRSHSQGGDLWREDGERKGKRRWGYVKGNFRTGGITHKYFIATLHFNFLKYF